MIASMTGCLTALVTDEPHTLNMAEPCKRLRESLRLQAHSAAKQCHKSNHEGHCCISMKHEERQQPPAHLDGLPTNDEEA